MPSIRIQSLSTVHSRLLGLVLLLTASGMISAQTVSLQQTIELEPGWNAVYLYVDPTERNIATLFAGLPVASIWRWLPSEDGARFIQDPAEGLDNVEGWFAWFPEPRPEAFLTNLFQLSANTAYLIKLEGTQTRQITIEGRPRVRSVQWVSDGFTLTGLPVSADHAPTFGEFFAHSGAHQDQPVYRLQPSGHWQPVSPSTTPIQKGKAYWIHTRGSSRYQGPMTVQLEQGDSLEFSAALEEMTLTLRNRSSLPGTFQVRRLQGSTLPMSFRLDDPETFEVSWPFLPAVYNVQAPARDDVQIVLALQRQQFSASRMEQIFEITDELGTKVYVHSGGNTIQPFIAPGGTPAGMANGLQFDTTQGGGERSLAGLWMGEVQINAVSESQLAGVEPTPVREPFSQRFLIHVDTSGQARLIKDVIQMWEEGTLKPSDLDPTLNEVDEPGRFVLITDRDLIGIYSGVALRGDRSVGIRYSTVAYDFPGEYLEFTGEFELGGQINATIVIEPDFPTNPFLHRYHPDHDNLDAEFLNFQKEAYQVVREMRLELTVEDPLGLNPPGWGETLVGGLFDESITGLHRNTIFTSGQFRMRRVSAVPILNQ